MISYKDSGVDVELADKLVKHLGFKDYGAIIDLGSVLVVLSTDGVGTKLLVAEERNKFHTIGIDLVAMCTNDVLCSGAKPHSFLDYYATGKLDLEKSKSILAGIKLGCELAGCELVGGETAEMPGVYEGTKFDLAGFCMGVIDPDDRFYTLPRYVTPGDILLGIPSSGPHANGYSLLRKLLPSHEIPLTPTRIYTNEILDNKDWIKACAHITGGGIHGNLPRILGDYNYELQYDIPDGFWSDLLERSKLPRHEFESVFNCGYGMIVVTNCVDSIDIPDAVVIGKVI